MSSTVIAIALASAACISDAPEALDDHQIAVAERGAEVMPFDLDATMHHFEPTDSGLVLTVVALDPSDAEQVALVREHLEHEAARFTAGDFGDPERIHGTDMPGLSELEDRAAAIGIRFKATDDGAQLTFEASDPELVEALHRWGAAQVADHGPHATAHGR